ncbi:MAG: hypothetical protein M3305_02895 [Actinomycetota bacterium]|nr:hypothetical protein [Actinomycetota bacterium]
MELYAGDPDDELAQNPQDDEQGGDPRRTPTIEEPLLVEPSPPREDQPVPILFEFCPIFG